MSSPIVVSPRGTAPLWTVHAIALLSSIGTAVVQQGVYLLLKARYDAAPSINFGVGLLFGVMYLAAALGIGPAIDRINRRSKKVTTRLILGLVLVAMAFTCAIPWAAQTFLGSTSIAWWWVVVAVYSPLTGLQWPLVESYLSGGRTEAALRKATGQFNVVWGGSMLVSYVLMSPLIKSAQTELIALVGIIHILTLLVLLAMPRDPAAHGDHVHVPPADYRRHLAIFRILLPTSYLVAGTLMPFLPSAVERLQFGPEFWALVIATWHAARVLTFAVMGRWHGWHGRWATPNVGAAGMLLGFCICLLAPLVGSHAGMTIGQVMLILGLAPLGMGMGVIYAGAIYYALEVGQADVDAGGAHESLIGLGMTLGPGCGLAISGASEMGWIAQEASDAALLVFALVAGLVFCLVALRSSMRHARVAATPPSELPPPA